MHQTVTCHGKRRVGGSPRRGANRRKVKYGDTDDISVGMEFRNAMSRDACVVAAWQHEEGLSIKLYNPFK